jgi:hypothetical protein
MIQNHATWKYGWKATTSLKTELMGALIFPVDYKISLQTERGEVFITDPQLIAEEMGKKRAEEELERGIKTGTLDQSDKVQSVSVWEMADNRIR